MQKSLGFSILLHVVVIILLTSDIASLWRPEVNLLEVPIIVDLQDVKITDITNLPKLVKEVEKPKNLPEEKQPQIVKKAEPEDVEEARKKENIAANEKAPEPEPEKVEPKPEPKEEVKEESDAAELKLEEEKQAKKKLEEKKKQEEEKKAKKEKEELKKKMAALKPPPKPKTAPKPKENKKEEPKLDSAMQSLLASVGEIKKNIANKPKAYEIEKGSEELVNTGVEGGQGGSWSREISISEKDAIGGRLRNCWNLDPGARGIDNMVVEIRAYLEADGSVSRADILDKSRYNNDKFFRSVAESARRAVFICSPFSLFPEKYPEQYGMWRTLLLRFNPLNGGVY